MSGDGNGTAGQRPAPRRRAATADFMRAARHLAPHRASVIVSIVCALLVGAVFTSGLSAMLPIFKVLLEDQTVSQWMDRQIAEQRLKISLDDDADGLVARKVDPGGPAGRAGVRRGDVLMAAGGEGAGTLAVLVQPGAATVTLIAGGQPKAVELTPLPLHWRVARRVAGVVPQHPVKAIAVVFAAIVVLAVIGSTLRFFQEHLSERAAILAVNDLRKRLYDHVLHVPMSFFGTRGASDVTSRLINDAQALQDGLKMILGKAIQEPINAFMALALSLYVNWKLTLFIVLFAPLMGVLIKKFGKKMRRASRKAMEESSTMLGQVESTLAGIRVVKAARAERFERRRYRQIMEELVRHQVRMSRIDTISTPTLETLTLLIVGAVVVYAAYLVKVTGELTNAKFFLVMACLMAMAESLRKVSKLNNHLQRSGAAAARIFEALELPIERPRDVIGRPAARAASSPAGAVSRPRPIKLPPIQSEIRFTDIHFTYPSAASPALEGVNLTVPRGSSVAIVGRNGSGKTTLLALLPRFYDPNSGSVTIDGRDIRDVTLSSLRRQIAVVTQEAVVFPGTIAENIAYGRPTATRAEIEDAARRAFAHEFILEKPRGYDTLLGEMGGQLSGGQRQRLNIARAILRQSPILILDEATSQVDAESEHLIQQAIDRLMHERTTFVIAHRFSTILSADSIVVMDRGQIVGQGQHDELLRTCPTYQQLYERQLFVPPAA